MISCQTVDLHLRATGTKSEVIVSRSLTFLPVYAGVGTPDINTQIYVKFKHFMCNIYSANILFGMSNN